MGNFFGFAPIVTRVAPIDTNATTVFSGGSMRIWGFTISNITAGTVTATITTNETSPTTIFSSTILANTNVPVPIPFIADKGLQVTTSSANALAFSFYHSQVGS